MGYGESSTALRPGALSILPGSSRLYHQSTAAAGNVKAMPLSHVPLKILRPACLEVDCQSTWL